LTLMQDSLTIFLAGFFINGFAEFSELSS